MTHAAARFLEAAANETDDDTILRRALNAGLTVDELATIYGMWPEDMKIWAREVLG